MVHLTTLGYWLTYSCAICLGSYLGFKLYDKTHPPKDHIYYVLASHPVESIQNLWIDDKQVQQ